MFSQDSNPGRGFYFSFFIKIRFSIENESQKSVDNTHCLPDDAITKCIENHTLSAGYRKYRDSRLVCPTPYFPRDFPTFPVTDCWDIDLIFTESFDPTSRKQYVFDGFIRGTFK